MRLLSLIIFFLYIIPSNAQSDDSRHNSKALLAMTISEHQLVVDSLTQRLQEIEKSEMTYPYWKIRGGAIGGFNLNSFSNWANRGDNTNSSASILTLGCNGNADLKGSDYFWRNRGRLLVAWQRFQRNESEDVAFQKTADMLQLVTHYGQNVTEKLAVSVLSEWESNLIDQTINPSYLDMSLGFTWTPNDYLSSVIHPLNYELALAEEDVFESSFGAKLILDYNQEIDARLKLASSFSGFLSYEQLDLLSNFTWTNGMNIKIIKSVGIAIEYAMRVSQQETLVLNTLDENHLQSYFLMGLSFELP